jgi:hypothetical protein
MVYGITFDVPAPVEMYDALHAEVLRTVGSSVDGLLVHVGRPTHDGFQILEVWESKEQYERANTEILVPIMIRLAGSDGPPPPEGIEFDVRGLVIPSGNIAD